jgi:predicted amidohydrolase
MTLGLAAATGLPVGIGASLGLPFVCCLSSTRLGSFEAALVFFAAGLCPMLSGLERYLSPAESFITPAAIWIFCTVLLAAPWALTWTASRRDLLWRVPAVLLITAIPPLGLIDFLSPLVGAGLLFPSCGWFGFFLLLALPGTLLGMGKARTWRWLLIAVAVVASIAANLFEREPLPLSRWEAVDTKLGDVSKPFKDYEAAQFIQTRVAESKADVLVFPEYVIPRWSEATQAFWAHTLARSAQRGQILVLGAAIPRPYASGSLKQARSLDFSPAIAALKDPLSKTGLFTTSTAVLSEEPFDNSVIVLGSERSIFRQRIPVPLGMWRPFSDLSVPLRLAGSGVVRIDNQCAAILICYEQLIPWPVLTSMLERPTVIVGISNTFWFNGTAVPRYQQSAMRAWARLFASPLISAVNS